MRATLTPLLATLAGLLLSLSVVERAEAQWGYYNRLGIHRQQLKANERQTYRPTVRILRPSSSRTLKSGQTYTYEFYARRGYVSRIEVRSGFKVVKTIRTGNARSGRGTISVNSSELRNSFGKPTFRLWAWQGKPAHQSLHGESIGYTLID